MMRFSRRQVAMAGLAYLVLMTYASTVVGPMGMHFVWRDPAEALQALLHVGFIPNGSDQRADWMGNLMMLVPFGFLIVAAIPGRRTVASLVALVLAVQAICAIKYLQLFFPPRTVTLNYITAQTLGAMAGIAAWHAWMGTAAQRKHTQPVEIVVLVLRLYLLALTVFVLEPLDFVLNASDFWVQMMRIPGMLATLPGPERPLEVRAFVLLASTLGFLPVGVLLTFMRTPEGWRPCRPLAAIVIRGLALATALYAAATLVMGAWPVLASVVYRTFGIVAGALAFRWLMRTDLAALRHALGRAVPWLAGLYLVAVLLANRLVSAHWLTPHQAMAQAYPLGLLPLFDYYIVSKANAAKNIAGHVLMYFPVGALIWLRAPARAGGRLAFGLAFLLALVVEAARYLRPGLEGDINTVVLAGLSAWAATRIMPFGWALLEELARASRNARDP